MAAAPGVAPDAATADVAPAPGTLNPQFGADVGAATRNRDTTLQNDAADRTQLGSTYGFGVDATGNVFDDHTNPFSRAAALQTAYDQSVRGTTNSMAARGQAYSGAQQNAQDWNATQNLKGRDALIREFSSARTGLDRRDTAATNAYSDALSAAAAADAAFQLANARPEPAFDPQAAAGTQAATQAAAQAAAKKPTYGAFKRPSTVLSRG